MAENARALADRTPETAPFWQAAAVDRLVLPCCTICEAFHWLPRSRCPACDSTELEWRTASGRGTIHSFAVMHRESPPVTHAIVMLEEGVAMMSRIRTDSTASVWIGMPVVCLFEPLNEVEHAVVFAPFTSASITKL